MNRKQRTKIMHHMDLNDLFQIFEKLRQLKFEIINPPSTGLVLLNVKEPCLSSHFYKGELLVSECKVRMDGVVGLGITSGIDLERAKIMAMVDAAYKLDLPIGEEITQILKNAEKEICMEIETDNHRIQKTRVSFETLYEEVKF